MQLKTKNLFATMMLQDRGQAQSSEVPHNALKPASGLKGQQ